MSVSLFSEIFPDDPIAVYTARGRRKNSCLLPYMRSVHVLFDGQLRGDVIFLAGDTYEIDARGYSVQVETDSFSGLYIAGIKPVHLGSIERV